MRRRAVIAGLLLSISAALMVLLARDAPQQPRSPGPLQIPAAPSPEATPAGESPRQPVPRASEGARYSPPVRVNVTPDGVATLTVSVDGPWELRPVGGGRAVASGNRLDPGEVTATATGFRIGNRAHAGHALELHARSSPSIWVDDHQYRGDVRLYRRADRTLVAVNVVPLEDYVASVVDSEMPAAFGDEARKAQAIVARTYAVWRMAEGAGHPEFELYNSSRSQKYLGFQYRTADGRRLAGESDSSRRVTRETAGVVCLWNERPFCTYYCAVCGGRTTDGTNVFADAAEPLKSVPCDWCREAELYRWTSRLSRAEAAKLVRGHFAARGEPFGTLGTLRKSDPGDESPGATFDAADGQRTRAISAVELRRLLPALHSPYFTIRAEGDEFVFTGRGHGHGAGLCQWGARGLAATGKDCYDILRHYYPGAGFAAIAPRTE